MFRRFTLALVGVVALAACEEQTESPVSPVTATAEVARQGQFLNLTLLHNNDAESSLLADGEIGGVARFAELVDALRADGEDCGPRGRARNYDCDVLVVSSGDNFLAGPQFQASVDNAFDPFYDAIGVNAIDYDAIAIGNHEFDFGPGVLAEFIGAVDGVPFLSANLDVGPETELAGVADRIAPWTIVETTGGPVGIIGATTDRLPEISSPGDVAVNPVLPAVESAIDALEGEGIDRIILISHLQSVEEDRALIEQLRGIDIVVAGGGDELLAAEGDELLPGDEPDGPYPLIVRDAGGNDVPLVTTSGSFEYVGRLEVLFRGGEIQRVIGGSGPVPVIGGAQDAALLASVEAPVESAVDALDVVIGSTEILLDGTRSLVRTQETAYGSLIADAILAAAPGADIALANGGGIRNSVVIGDAGLPADITRLDTFNTLPFANFVYTIEGVTPQRLKDVLENAVSRVEFTDGRFAQVSGLEFTYDAAAPAGSRVLEVIVGGTPYVSGGVVDDTRAALDLGIVNFLANGGDGYPLDDLPVTTTTTTYQKALEDYIVGALGGTVEASEVPLGRITRLN